MQSLPTPWYADTYPDMHVCGPIYILVPRHSNIKSSVHMDMMGAKYWCVLHPYADKPVNYNSAQQIGILAPSNKANIIHCMFELTSIDLRPVSFYVLVRTQR